MSYMLESHYFRYPKVTSVNCELCEKPMHIGVLKSHLKENKVANGSVRCFWCNGEYVVQNKVAKKLLFSDN